MLSDNPAARLKAILEKGYAAKKDAQCMVVWRDVLEAQPRETDDLFARLGKVMELPREIVLLLKEHFPQHVEASTLWRQPIETAFMSQQLTGKWESFIQYINAYCISHLGLLADLLNTKLHQHVVAEADVLRAIEQMEILISDLQESTLSASLKIYLMKELSLLVQALREYKITGAEAVLKQTESMIGHVHRDKEYLEFLRDHEFGKRVLDNLNAVAALLTICVSAPQLAYSVYTLLPKL